MPIIADESGRRGIHFGRSGSQTRAGNLAGIFRIRNKKKPAVFAGLSSNEVLYQSIFCLAYSLPE